MNSIQSPASFSSEDSPLGPAPPVRNGATFGVTRIFIGVLAGRVENCGTNPASSVEVTGSGVPARSSSVMSWFRRPHSVIAPRSWLNVDDEMTIPSPYGAPVGVVFPSVG